MIETSLQRKSEGNFPYKKQFSTNRGHTPKFLKYARRSKIFHYQFLEFNSRDKKNLYICLPSSLPSYSSRLNTEFITKYEDLYKRMHTKAHLYLIIAIDKLQFNSYTSLLIYPTNTDIGTFISILSYITYVRVVVQAQFPNPPISVTNSINWKSFISCARRHWI